MPLPLSPNDSFKLVLTSDQELPEGEQPKFVFRCLSGRDQRTMLGMMDEFEKCEISVEAFDKTYEMLKFVLVGWENLRDPRNNNELVAYDPAHCEDVLQLYEVHNLIRRVMNFRPSGEALKNFESQSNTPSNSSASPEPAGNA